MRAEPSPSAPPPWPAILLVGPTGSGKTPLGDELECRGLRGRRCLHFDFGANLRTAAAGGAGDTGLTLPEVEAIRASLRSGALFEDRDLPMIEKILGRFARRRGLGRGDLLVLNGLPRHRDQAEALSPLISVERVVALEAAAPVIQERIRRNTGGDRAPRSDDDPGEVARRIDIFRNRTAPLLDHYRERGVPITTVIVTAGMTAADMYAALERGLGPAGV